MVYGFSSCPATDSGWGQKNENTVADWVQIKAASLTSQLEQERSVNKSIISEGSNHIFHSPDVTRSTELEST